MKKLIHYFSLVKFSHTIFAMPFALLGFFLAIHAYPDSFQWRILLLVLLCMIFARNAAMAFNRYVDREIDKQNPRTANREIPQGIISPKSALTFVILNSLFFVITTAFMNKLVFFLSPLALFTILGYSYTKHFTYYCHLVLGLGLALSPIGAYLAVAAQFDFLPVLLSFVVLFWTAGFDIIYALQDETFDKKNKLHSIPSKVGVKKARRIAAFFHAGVSFLIASIGLLGSFSCWYWVGAAIFLLLLFNQHRILQPNHPKSVQSAFLIHNGLASILYAFFVILSLYL